MVKTKGTKEYVYVIEDEKYGVQAVFREKDEAKYACENDDRYHVSGQGATVVKWELRELTYDS